jgi:L-asparaginase II
VIEIVLERGGRVESSHRVHAAVVSAEGQLAGGNGHVDFATFLRSAAKPFQALPLVEEGAVEALGITPEELAVCCGSHGGEPEHLARVRSLLERADAGESDLACGPHLPLHQPSAHALLRGGTSASKIHNNCSGKHAGMLALARHCGWPIEGYRDPGHPVQKRMLREIVRWTGVPEPEILPGTDGCGVVCFGLPLRAIALAFARFGQAARGGDEGPAAVIGAMAGHPFFVAGSGRLCTQLAEVTGGRLIAKVGAEGVYGAVDLHRGLGVALKVVDGARRACEVALLTILMEVGVLEPAEIEELEHRWDVVVPNTLGEPAARLRAEGRLECA